MSEEMLVDEIVDDNPIEDALGEVVEREEVEPEVAVEPEPEPEKEEPAEPEAVEPVNVPLAALEAERKKRQDAERLLEEQQRNARSKEPEEKPDFWEDPDKAIDARLRKVQEEADNRHFSMSETIARRDHEDFQEKFETFTEMAKHNPMLIQEAKRAAHPAEFIYQKAKEEALVATLRDGGMEELEAKIYAKARQELEAEIEGKVAEKVTQLSKLPPSASKTAGKTTRSAPEQLDDDPLGSALGE